MRINKFVAQASGLSRRAADSAIADGRVSLNSNLAGVGDTVSPTDIVMLDGATLTLPETHLTLMLNKPTGYVCSRNGQGSMTVYDLLPDEYQQLKPVGRLDKYSSGLILLTSDGDLANTLTHPRYLKQKKYEVRLDKSLSREDSEKVKHGIKVDDYISHLIIENQNDSQLRLSMSEGKNHQIRKTFQTLGYQVIQLNRSAFGDYRLAGLAVGRYRIV
jgi:23S rRNA pseudouridine2605 synthase